MKLILAFVVWIGMAVVLSKGVLMALHGSVGLLIAGVIAFILMVAKIGCLSHD